MAMRADAPHPDDYPCIEVSGTEYRDFLKSHPQHSHLRRGVETSLRPELHFVYDLEAFEADKSYSKRPIDHRVADRFIDGSTGVMRYRIHPKGCVPKWVALNPGIWRNS